MKQLIPVATGPIHAKVMIPGSKSMTNRALLLAALASGVSELTGVLISDDTKVFIDALRQLGIMIQLIEADRACIVGGCDGKFPKNSASIWCEKSGITERFLLAACASSVGSYQFDGDQQLRDRPLKALIDVLRSQGATFVPADATELPLTIVGKESLAGGEIEIDGSQTGQFISALLMIAPFAKSKIMLKTNELVSHSYIDMTCDMMGEFGVLVRRMHHTRFSVPVPQHYQARDYVVEPDLSTASYFFAAAAVTNGEVTIQPIERKSSKQGDVKFLSVLEKMGCTVNENAAGLTVKGSSELQGVKIDMRDFSDTFMTLAALAPFAKTPTTITNIGHTRLQESDRITAMQVGLEKLKVKVEAGSDWIKIYPSQPQAATIDSYHDHRIAMAFSIIGLRVAGVEINDAECVTKTCPDFFKMWEALL